MYQLQTFRKYKKAPKVTYQIRYLQRSRSTKPSSAEQNGHAVAEVEIKLILTYSTFAFVPRVLICLIAILKSAFLALKNQPKNKSDTIFTYKN